MTTFFLHALLYTALLLGLATPVLVVARRQGRPSTVRNFALWGVIVGSLMAVTKVSSDRLVQQCLDVGNSQCFDYGSAGILVMFGGGYAVVAWLRAWILSH